MTQEELAQLMYMQKGGLSRADTAGLFGANMKINPYMAGVGVLSAIPSLQQNIKQDRLLKELQREGVQDITPQAFKQYQMGVNNQANNAKIAGYGTALENINRGQAAGLGNVYKASINPSQALRGALALNQQGIQARNQLDMQGAQAQQARQNLANQAMMQRGQFQEKGRQEYNSAVSALRGAKAQNWNNFVQGLTGAALNSYVIGGPKKTPDDKTTTPPPPPTTTTQYPTVPPQPAAAPAPVQEQYQKPAYQNFVNQIAPKVLPGFMAQERNSPNPLTNIPSLNDGKQNPLMGGKSYMGFDGKQYYGSNFDGTTYASTNPNTSTPIVTPVPAPATPVAAPVAAAIAPDPVSPPPAVVIPERDGQDISSPMPKKEELVAGPPAPTTQAQVPAPPLNKKKAYSTPLTRSTLDGGKVVYSPDGTFTEYSSNGEVYTNRYRVLDNGRIAMEDNYNPTDLEGTVPTYNKNDRQSLIKRLFNYGR